MDNQDLEILQSFVEESREHLADIEADLLVIEQQGPQVEDDLINKVFRAAHSIKGGAGFLGLDVIKNLAHSIETVLGAIRNRTLIPNPEIVSILLRCFDKLKAMLEDVSESNNQDISEYLAALEGIGSVANRPSEGQTEGLLVDLACPPGMVGFRLPMPVLEQAFSQYKHVLILRLDLIQDLHNKEILPTEFLELLERNGKIIDMNFRVDPIGSSDQLCLEHLPVLILVGTDLGPAVLCEHLGIATSSVFEVRRDLTVKAPDLPNEPTQAGQASGTDAAEQRPSELQKGTAIGSACLGQTTLRVNVKLLDDLMNLAGELVLSRNELVQAAGIARQDMVKSATQRISLVTSELQEAIMRTRMQPIGNLFGRFPRVVRDLANQLGKKIDLSIEGSDVELDKTIIEGLADPLTHLVRNAVDHGIESPADRLAAGKGEVGRVWLKAYHEAGQVNIEVGDDGKGIDPDRVARAAVEKGLVSPQQVQAMSDKEKISLIFLAGLSAAERVTDISGRGVGMDVVKTNLEKLGGQIEVDTRLGAGTTTRLKLPLTLAIIPSLMVSCQQNRYALPMVNVVELLRIVPSKTKNLQEKVGDVVVLRLRDQLLPVISLSKILGYQQEDQQDKILNIVVVSAGALRYGLIVDQLHDSEEIVVKPLNGQLKKVGVYAGATILGDGQVALILDVVGLAQMAGLDYEQLGSKAGSEANAAISATAALQSLLVFSSAQPERFGVPINLVDRIEQIKAHEVKSIGGKKVIRYREGILPVYTIDEVIKAGPLAQKDDLLVVVFNRDGARFGLLATGPVDTVQLDQTIDTQTLYQPGLIGSVVIGDSTILILDVQYLADLLAPKATGTASTVDPNGRPTILYVEDSEFFRQTVKGMLQQAGYDVVDAVDGLDAMRILEQCGQNIRLVLTDIEMPNLDGIGLAKRIKADRRFQHIPVMALTTLASDLDMEKGRAAGLCQYQIKLDKDNLLGAVGQLVGRP
ncbi:MAG: chemotaxis protein CheW [Sedimentisphaerales bacterium]|nr:chemotaxis protein CheW [Sedimentisphaerales bacterium]